MYSIRVVTAWTGGLYIGNNQFNISSTLFNGNKAFSGGSIYIKAPLAVNASLSRLNFGAQNAATRGDSSLRLSCTADAAPKRRCALMRNLLLCECLKHAGLRGFAGRDIYWAHSASPNNPLSCYGCNFADPASSSIATEVISSVFLNGPVNGTFSVTASQVHMAECLLSMFWTFRSAFSNDCESH